MTEQFCPICKEVVKPQLRYPDYVCESCLVDGVEVDGVNIPKSQIDVHSNLTVNCIVHGVSCVAQEARFGGTVVQVI